MHASDEDDSLLDFMRQAERAPSTSTGALDRLKEQERAQVVAPQNVCVRAWVCRFSEHRRRHSSIDTTRRGTARGGIQKRLNPNSVCVCMCRRSECRRWYWSTAARRRGESDRSVEKRYAPNYS